MERLVEICGDEEMKAELWEELGKALGISDERLEKISVEEKDNLEKCKQCVLHVRNNLMYWSSNHISCRHYCCL